MVGVAPILFIFWKVIKRTKFVKPHEADLVWDRPVIDAYEETFYGPPSSFWKEMLNVSCFTADFCSCPRSEPNANNAPSSALLLRSPRQAAKCRSTPSQHRRRRFFATQVRSGEIREIQMKMKREK